MTKIKDADKELTKLVKDWKKTLTPKELEQLRRELDD